MLHVRLYSDGFTVHIYSTLCSIPFSCRLLIITWLHPKEAEWNYLISFWYAMIWYDGMEVKNGYESVKKFDWLSEILLHTYTHWFVGWINLYFTYYMAI